jgi:hypothetical protein
MSQANVMQRAVVKYRPTRPLPSEISSERVNAATLPMKVEAARLAIARCEDLSELLKYKEQAEGLAAAVRVMKTIGPEMIRSANEMVMDAWRKGGELLLRYKGCASAIPVRGGRKGGTAKSPRVIAAGEAGLSPNEVLALTRLAAAPISAAYLAAEKSSDLRRAAQRVPVRCPGLGRAAHSATLAVVFGNSRTNIPGLIAVLATLKRIPLGAFSSLPPEERKLVKSKIVEIMEVLDEMDRLCR